MFDMVDTAFSYGRGLIVCSSLQEFSKAKESTLHVIWNVDTAFLLCEAELENCEAFKKVISQICNIRGSGVQINRFSQNITVTIINSYASVLSKCNICHIWIVEILLDIPFRIYTPLWDPNLLHRDCAIQVEFAMLDFIGEASWIYSSWNPCTHWEKY